VNLVLGTAADAQETSAPDAAEIAEEASVTDGDRREAI
jgi:hypothetical protein